MATVSSLEHVLTTGGFAVTAEIAPPKSGSPATIRQKTRILKDIVDAVNVTDNQAAVARLSSLAAAVHVVNEGAEPVMHITCRDRNILGLQSELLGAWSLGVRNILVLSGDRPGLGNHPNARAVFDVDSIGLTRIASGMRDRSCFENGEEMKGAPRFFIGVGQNLYGEPVERLRRKVDAGADFVQTQPVFDVNAFAKWLTAVRDAGLLDRVHILAGILPMKSHASLVRLSRVPGINVPEEVLERMAGVPEDQQEEEAIAIAVETACRLKELPGIRGLHIMAVNWPEVVKHVTEGAGILPNIKAASD